MRGTLGKEYDWHIAYVSRDDKEVLAEVCEDGTIFPITPDQVTEWPSIVPQYTLVDRELYPYRVDENGDKLTW